MALSARQNTLADMGLPAGLGPPPVHLLPSEAFQFFFLMSEVPLYLRAGPLPAFPLPSDAGTTQNVPLSARQNTLADMGLPAGLGTPPASDKSGSWRMKVEGF